VTARGLGRIKTCQTHTLLGLLTLDVKVFYRFPPNLHQWGIMAFHGTEINVSYLGLKDQRLYYGRVTCARNSTLSAETYSTR